MDKIADEGVRFTHMHSAASLCAPSRYSILTGNLPMRGSMPNGEWALHNPLQMTTGQRTTAHLFRDAGYKTGYVGKVHLGGGLLDTDGRSMKECLAKTSSACQIDWMQGIQQRSMLKSVAHPCLLALGYVSSEGKKRLSFGFTLGCCFWLCYTRHCSAALHNASAVVCNCPLYTQLLRKEGVCVLPRHVICYASRNNRTGSATSLGSTTSLRVMTASRLRRSSTLRTESP